MVITRSELGALGEEQVTHYLKEHGYTIIMRNARWRGGEIDIIAHQKSIVACVEVKTRISHFHDGHDYYFSLSTIITPTKQLKIIRTAHYLMSTLPEFRSQTLRFDVALVTKEAEPLPSTPQENNASSTSWHISYIPNAFTAPADYFY